MLHLKAVTRAYFRCLLFSVLTPCISILIRIFDSDREIEFLILISMISINYLGDRQVILRRILFSILNTDRVDKAFCCFYYTALTRSAYHIRLSERRNIKYNILIQLGIVCRCLCFFQEIYCTVCTRTKDSSAVSSADIDLAVYGNKIFKSTHRILILFQTANS